MLFRSVVGIYAQSGTSTRIVCFLRAIVSRWISGVFLAPSAESEEGYTGELCLAPFRESRLPTHYHTYPRPTCKFWWDSGAPELIPPENGGLWAPGGLPP